MSFFSKIFVLSSFVFLFSASSFAAIEDLPKVKGTVKQIIVAQQSVKIKHEEIPNLDMPAMIMTFIAADPILLDGLNKEDKIFFRATEMNGELVVIWVEKQ